METLSRKHIKKILKNSISILVFIITIFLIVDEKLYYSFNDKINIFFDGITNNIVSMKNDILESVDIYENNEDSTITKTVRYVWSDKIVSDSYFEDALFIGDSRLLFFSHYKFLRGAIWYCKENFGVFDGLDVPMWIDFIGKKSINDLLTEHNFGKIYINLGINYLDKNIETHKVAFINFINGIRAKNSTAVIYILSNIHMTEAKQKMPYLTNEQIDKVNAFLKSFENGSGIFYIDITSIYDDEEHNLKSDYSYDGLHIYEKYYDELYDILVRKTVENSL